MLVARDFEVTPPGGIEPAVHGVSLSVGPGEWVALAGPNGGGKTSLLLALAGLWPISGGTLDLDGVPFGPHTRAHAGTAVAVVMQDPSSQLLQPTVREELGFAAHNLGQPDSVIAARVERWSEALGLTAELDRDPTTLSAGRQQLVLLAAALVSEPRLLLADEPTAHLDAATRIRVCEVIAARVRAGLSVVWATQDRNECASATRTVVVGDSVPETPGPLMASVTPVPGDLLRIRVSPDAGAEGPRIHLGRPLEFSLGERGVTALLGPNGAGKSVLIAATAGLSPSPQVVVEWRRNPANPPIVTLQYPELQIFEEAVADEVVFAAVARGLKRSKALAAAAICLSRMGFDPTRFLARRTWSLSTGEKRLVEVVGALIAPSCLVLLDEPTAGLDPERRKSLCELVVARAEGVPFMIASQDHEWVARVGAQTVTLGV